MQQLSLVSLHRHRTNWTVRSSQSKWTANGVFTRHRLMSGSRVSGCLIQPKSPKWKRVFCYYRSCCQGSCNILWAKHGLKCFPPCQELVELLKRHWVLSSAQMALPFAFVCCSASRLLWFRPRNDATAIRWTFMKFLRDVQGPQRVNPNGFIDPLTVPLAPPELHLSSEMAQHPQFAFCSACRGALRGWAELSIHWRCWFTGTCSRLAISTCW